MPEADGVPVGAEFSDGSAHPVTSVDAEEFARAKQQGKELEASPADPTPELSSKLEDQIPGIRFLASLLKATIFTDLFVYHAHMRYVYPSEQERVDALIEAHPTFYKLCRNSDYIARAVLAVVTTGLVVAAAVGTIVRLFFH